MVILKPLDAGSSWLVSHKDNTGNSDLDAKYLQLESSGTGGNFPEATSASSNYHFYTSSDSNWDVNESGVDVIMYSFKGVSGVSAFGTYTGNGGAYDSSTGKGGVTDMGFEPKWLMVKQISSAGSWVIYDKFRGGGDDSSTADYNRILGANIANSENDSSFWGTDSTLWEINVDNTGFKFTGNYGSVNTSNETYIYMAFA